MIRSQHGERANSEVFDRIAQIFKQRHIVLYEEDRANRTLRLEIDAGWTTVTFDHLERLSQVLGTKDINLSSTHVVDQGCDTCGHGRLEVMPISCRGVICMPAENPCFFERRPGHRCELESTNRTKRLCDVHAPIRCGCGKQAIVQAIYRLFSTDWSDEPLCRACFESVKQKGELWP